MQSSALVGWPGTPLDWTAHVFEVGNGWLTLTRASRSANLQYVTTLVVGIQGDSEFRTFYDIYKVLRECMQTLSKNDVCDPFPGSFNSTFPRIPTFVGTRAAFCRKAAPWATRPPFTPMMHGL